MGVDVGLGSYHTLDIDRTYTSICICMGITVSQVLIPLLYACSINGSASSSSNTQSCHCFVPYDMAPRMTLETLRPELPSLTRVSYRNVCLGAIIVLSPYWANSIWFCAAIVIGSIGVLVGGQGFFLRGSVRYRLN